jgi:hypothetical protein
MRKLSFTSAPFFLLVFMIVVKIIRSTRLVYRITDFYPEVLIAELGHRSWFLMIERLIWYLRRKVDAFEVLGNDQRAILTAGGIASDRIYFKRDISPAKIRGDEVPIVAPGQLRVASPSLFGELRRRARQLHSSRMSAQTLQ